MSDNIDGRKVISSPGRINLIGEHIDYNGGHVLPAAIDRTITFDLTKNNTSQCRVRSQNYNDLLTIDLNMVKPTDTLWKNYILGVIHHINIIRPNSIKGFDCEIASNLPEGSGVSSSAALECGIAKGLNELFDIGLTDMQLILLSREAEHTFVGTNCGIMDQFAVVNGKKDHLILLNCANLEFKLINVNLNPYTILLLNTNVNHNLSTSEYNTRRAECESALKVVNQKYPEFKYLAEVPKEIILECKEELSIKEYNRAIYVVEENERVLKVAEALQGKHLEVVGKCLYETHAGLKDLYEVSCKELDFLVDFSTDFEYVIGARMMGGGFGGCTINLVHQAYVDTYIFSISKRYKRQFGIELTPIKVGLGNGVNLQEV